MSDLNPLRPKLSVINLAPTVILLRALHHYHKSMAFMRGFHHMTPSPLYFVLENPVYIQRQKDPPSQVAYCFSYWNVVAMYCRHQGCKIHSRLPPHAGDLPRYYTTLNRVDLEFDGDETHNRYEHGTMKRSRTSRSLLGCPAAALTAHKQEARGAAVDDDTDDDDDNAVMVTTTMI
jgi:hypothetical protein